MDLSHTLIHHMTSNVDACFADCSTTHTILRDKNYFSNLSLVKSNVNTILGLIDLIQGSGRTTIILPRGTKIHINDPFILLNPSKIFLVSRIFAEMDITL